MKNIFVMTVMLLLASSCGLFKKTVKTSESHILEARGEVMVLSKIDSSSNHLEVGQSYGRILKQSEDLMQIEGEEIEISPDGIVRISKGRINKKLTLHADSGNVFSKRISGQSQQIIENVLHKDEKLKLAERTTRRTERPMVTSMLFLLPVYLFWQAL
ncbi:hypothetical protein [Sphingobacterium sp. HMA12]|uniref:hypothetical protein n=1 Tax=Sphingobacterium sp. HMA12 TaxID=2050894 RepID=UPI001315035B|nr:hypothetical protein [Sphingobacterium sp. HMA12]